MATRSSTKIAVARCCHVAIPISPEKKDGDENVVVVNVVAVPTTTTHHMTRMQAYGEICKGIGSTILALLVLLLGILCGVITIPLMVLFWPSTFGTGTSGKEMLICWLASVAFYVLVWFVLSSI